MDWATLLRQDYSAGAASFLTRTEWELARAFRDPNADFNGSVSTVITVGGPPFTLDSGSPLDPKVDISGDAVGPWGLALVNLLTRQVLVPLANNAAMVNREPNVSIDVRFSLYGEDRIGVPGIVIGNRSGEPIWVDGVVINNAGSYSVRIPSTTPSLSGPAVLPPVVEPGASGALYLLPATAEQVFPISPRIEATVQMHIMGVSQSVDLQIASAGAMLEAHP
jgi:hypothetical protein